MNTKQYNYGNVKQRCKTHWGYPVPLSVSEKKYFADLGIADRVTHFTGGDDVLAVLYKNATAFVYPSLYEGFGIPLLFDVFKWGYPSKRRHL